MGADRDPGVAVRRGGRQRHGTGYLRELRPYACTIEGGAERDMDAEDRRGPGLARTVR